MRWRRYCARIGVARLRSVVFASSVTPYLLHTKDNPDGPLSVKEAAQMAASLTKNQDAFYDQFVTDFFSVDGELKVTDDQRKAALDLCHQAGKAAALACMSSFGKTDFREDLPKVTVPSLVIHGDGDATVPFEGSGKRTHEALPDSRLHAHRRRARTASTSATRDEFNDALLDFLAEDFTPGN